MKVIQKSFDQINIIIPRCHVLSANMYSLCQLFLAMKHIVSQICPNSIESSIGPLCQYLYFLCNMTH